MGRPQTSRTEFHRGAMPLKLLRHYRRSLNRFNGVPGRSGQHRSGALSGGPRGS